MAAARSIDWTDPGMGTMVAARWAFDYVEWSGLRTREHAPVWGVGHAAVSSGHGPRW